MLRRRLTLIGIALLVFLTPNRVGNAFRNKAVHLAAPLTSNLVRRSSRLSTALENIRSIPTLQAQRASLESQVVSLQKQLSDYETTKRENDTLRSELGVTGVTQQTHKVLAQVVLHSTDLTDTTFTVTVGSNQGVHEGQPVVSQGFLIGRIYLVRSTSAEVRTITSDQSRIQVWIADSREKGLLIGDGASAILSDITQGIQVTPHATVETSGLGGSLPQGILVGSINNLLSKPSDPSQRFRLTLPQDPNNLDSVFILTDQG